MRLISTRPPRSSSSRSSAASSPPSPRLADPRAAGRARGCALRAPAQLAGRPLREPDDARVVAEVVVAQLRVAVEPEPAQDDAVEAADEEVGQEVRAGLVVRERAARRARSSAAPSSRGSPSSAPRVPQSAYATTRVVARPPPRRPRRDPLGPVVQLGRQRTTSSSQPRRLRDRVDVQRERAAGDDHRGVMSGNPSWSMNRSLKSARPESSTYAHLVEDRPRGRPLGDRERRDLRALAGHVAGRDDARQRQLGHEPDADRARRREVRAERAGRAAPARRPRARCRARGRGSSSRSRSTPWRTAARARRAARGRRRRARQKTFSSPILPSRSEAPGDEASRAVEDPGADELGDRVDEARAAEADRLDVADHLQLDLAVLDPHALDRAVGGAHAAADLGRLERRPGGRGRGQRLGRASRGRSPSSCRRR